ncbi:hypothetical protein A2U01_0092126, partial [Trifolium medium]|nr:hypothetical protein [Trifolium medium]
MDALVEKLAEGFKDDGDMGSKENCSISNNHLAEEVICIEQGRAGPSQVGEG